MAYAEFATSLQEKLKLSHAPVGIAFLDEAPDGVKHYEEAVPSACAFWKAAESELFYATASDHYNCPIGAITQGFQIPQPVSANAMELIGMMGKISYLEAAEASNVPTVEKKHKVIVYGPLKDFGEFQPDVVLLVATPLQAMLISEASGVASWGTGHESRTLGRPACAVIPSSLKSNDTTISMACMGARTFADIKDEEVLISIPARALIELQNRLPVILEANVDMEKFYSTHKGNFAPV
ncbi:MAG TPA: DUF169 domain-containing protein [Candidatus Angelobacter sp.]|nr:DUF169 domain-containing protein [Candidatus Angelobacter sp.]